MKKVYKLSGLVNRFPMEIAWYYVYVPREITDEIFTKINLRATPFRFMPIEAELEGIKWNTALLPHGKKQFFIPVKKDVRKKTFVDLGDKVEISFSLRGV